jgi:hypothetical protein
MFVSTRLFEFEFKNIKFFYIQKGNQSSAVYLEVHADCSRGEEFLCNEDNYNDCFQFGRDIFIQKRIEQMKTLLETKTCS